MAKDLASTKISEELFANPDKIYSGQAMPVSSAITSSIFEVGKTLNALELVGQAVVAITNLTSVEYEYSVNADMSSSTTIALPIAGASVSAGAEIFRFAPDHTKPVYARLVITGAAGATGTLDVDIASVRKN